MSEAKHTPGPWLIEGATIYALDESGSVNRFSALVQSGYRRFGKRAGERITDGEVAANARLIGAAPDLLAAVKDGLRSSRKDFEVGPEGDRRHREAYSEQFAAIAKATGATP